MAKTFVFSDSTKNEHGFVLISKGGDVTQYLKNPVVLYMHERGNVIGRGENIRLEGDEWKFEPVFDLDDEFAKKIANKVDKDFIRAVSAGIGFNWDDVTIINDDLGAVLYAQLDKWYLKEISFCDIPSNSNALCLTDETGKNWTELNLADLPQHKLQNLTIPVMEKEILAAVVAALSLSADADKATILTKIGELNNSASKATDLQKQLQAQLDQKKQLALSAVDEAVKSGKITPAAKEGFLKLAENDADTTIQTLQAMTPATNLAEFTNKGSQSQAQLDLAATGDLVKEWDELDRQGKLELTQKNNPSKYNQMFEAKYGRKPTQ